MGAYTSTQGIIMGVSDYKEQDQLLKIYTKDHGKKSAVVKGVKKPASKLRGGVQLFALSNLTFVETGGLALVIGAETIESFPELHSDFIRMSYATYMLEVFDQLILEGEGADERCFVLLLQCLHLASYIDPFLATTVFVLRLLEMLGFRGEVEACGVCRAPFRLGFAPWWGLGTGAYRCQTCGHAPGAIFLSIESLRALDVMVHYPLAEMGRISLSSQSRQEIASYVAEYLTNLLSCPLKTRAFLHSLGEVI